MINKVEIHFFKDKVKSINMIQYIWLEKIHLQRVGAGDAAGAGVEIGKLNCSLNIGADCCCCCCCGSKLGPAGVLDSSCALAAFSAAALALALSDGAKFIKIL